MAKGDDDYIGIEDPADNDAYLDVGASDDAVADDDYLDVPAGEEDDNDMEDMGDRKIINAINDHIVAQFLRKNELASDGRYSFNKFIDEMKKNDLTKDFSSKLAQQYMKLAYLYEAVNSGSSETLKIEPLSKEKMSRKIQDKEAEMIKNKEALSALAARGRTTTVFREEVSSLKTKSPEPHEAPEAHQSTLPKGGCS